jgi:Immunity protein Imm1
MKKTTYFAADHHPGWPKPEELEHYFLAPPDERWFFETGNDSALFQGEGAHGTEHLQPGQGRIDIEFEMWGDPDLGVLLIWSKGGVGEDQIYTSKGDMTRIHEFVLSEHGTPLPIAFFIPYEKAWEAVKEFLETDGALPKSIEWVANRDLPPNTFPDPTPDWLREQGFT